MKSSEARIEERYRRPDADTIELRMTLYDPRYYTGPWVTDVKISKKEPRENVTYFGWYGLFSGLGELICAPLNANPSIHEADNLNIRALPCLWTLQ